MSERTGVLLWDVFLKVAALDETPKEVAVDSGGIILSVTRTIHII